MTVDAFLKLLVIQQKFEYRVMMFWWYSDSGAMTIYYHTVRVILHWRCRYACRVKVADTSVTGVVDRITLPIGLFEAILIQLQRSPLTRPFIMWYHTMLFETERSTCRRRNVNTFRYGISEGFYTFPLGIFPRFSQLPQYNNRSFET